MVRWFFGRLVIIKWLLVIFFDFRLYCVSIWLEGVFFIKYRKWLLGEKEVVFRLKFGIGVRLMMFVVLSCFVVLLKGKMVFV